MKVNIEYSIIVFAFLQTTYILFVAAKTIFRKKKLLRIWTKTKTDKTFSYFVLIDHDAIISLSLFRQLILIQAEYRMVFKPKFNKELYQSCIRKKRKSSISICRQCHILIIVNQQRSIQLSFENPITYKNRKKKLFA